MSKSKKPGLRIGHYRITPLGIGTIAALVLLAILAVVFAVTNSQTDAIGILPAAPTASPTPEVLLTPTPTASPEPTASPDPTPTPEPETRSATVRVLGEIAMEMDLLKSAYNQEDKTFDFSPMFQEIADIIGNADYTIADVDGTMGDTQGVNAGDAKMYTPSALLGALADAGVDMLMLANDHALDGGVEDLTATLANLQNAGLDYVGACASAEEKATPKVVDINGIQVGFVAYCNEMAVKVDSASSPYVSLISNSNATEDIQALKSAGAEVIIALVNWGEMYTHTANANQQKIAQFLNAAGADVIIGYNPRAVQPIKWLESTDESGNTQRTLCICAPGSLLSNQRTAGTDCGAIFEFTLREQEDGSIAVESPEYIPTYTLRYEREDGLYEYRAVAIDRYTSTGDALIDGMTASDVEYMLKLETAIETVLGTDVAQRVSE